MKRDPALVMRAYYNLGVVADKIGLSKTQYFYDLLEWWASSKDNVIQACVINDHGAVSAWSDVILPSFDACIEYRKKPNTREIPVRIAYEAFGPISIQKRIQVRQRLDRNNPVTLCGTDNYNFVLVVDEDTDAIVEVRKI